MDRLPGGGGDEPVNRPFKATHTWDVGKLDEARVRRVRELLYEWDITSTLRRRGQTFTLVIHAPLQSSLDFANEMVAAMKVIQDMDRSLDRLSDLLGPRAVEGTE